MDTPQDSMVVVELEARRQQLLKELADVEREIVEVEDILTSMDQECERQGILPWPSAEAKPRARAA